MKTFVCALVLSASLSQVEAAAYKTYAETRVSGIKNHLERVYGKGLAGMFDEKGDLSHERLRWARNRPAQNWVQFGGIQFNAESATSFIYGAASGLQYDGMTVNEDPAKAA